MAEGSNTGQSQQLADAARSRLDKISREESQIESLEAKKQDISETRDIQTIGDRQEAPAPRETEPAPTPPDKYVTSGG